MYGAQASEAKVVSAERNAWTRPAAGQRTEGELVLYSATAPGEPA
jgi:hypothetical protein